MIRTLSILAAAIFPALMPTGHGIEILRRDIGRTAPEMEMTTLDGTLMKLSSLRKKWVLLQCGGAWHRNSQATGQVFVHIRRALEGLPFEFVDIFDDPTSLDVQLFSFRTPVGIRAQVASRRDLDFCLPASLPAWYLIDPDGVVRAENGLGDPASLRRTIGDVLLKDPEFRNVSLAPLPEEAALENMMFLYIKGDYSHGELSAEKILESDPGNETVLQYLHFCASWTKGYPGAAKLLAAHLQNTKPSDRLLIYQALYRYIDSDTAETREAIRQFALKYPASRYLATILLMFDKLPDALTREEEDLLVTAKNTALDEVVDAFRGFVLQGEGRHPRAEDIFRAKRSRKNLAMLPLVASLTRQRRVQEASGVISSRPGLDTTNATPQDAWLKMHIDCVMQAWEDAARYAKRYQDVRPEKAQGLLVEWLADMMLDRQTQAAGLQEKALDLFKSSEKYRVAADLLGSNRLPKADDLTRIPDLNFRYDTALLFVLQEWQKGGRNGALKMLATLQPAFPPDEWTYPILEQLRTFTLK
jgi:hypothetical protein